MTVDVEPASRCPGAGRPLHLELCCAEFADGTHASVTVISRNALGGATATYDLVGTDGTWIIARQASGSAGMR